MVGTSGFTAEAGTATGAELLDKLHAVKANDDQQAASHRATWHDEQERVVWLCRGYGPRQGRELSNR